MKNVELENAASVSVKRAMKGDITVVDLVNFLKFQNREKDLSDTEAILLTLLSAAFN